MGSAILKPFEHNSDHVVFEAIRKNKFTLAKKLIFSGKDVDCINYLGATPLIETCKAPDVPNTRKKREEFVQFLINKGCKTGKHDIYGWTAVLYAEENGHLSISKILNRCESKASCYKRREDISFVLQPVIEELEIHIEDRESILRPSDIYNTKTDNY
ncbi:unnamed protein product [Mytilus coruscus]|uniref:Uncharacterized protein n=1 Tax=Mytilus coruscus TaxID=42192 RepID=A0A6J8DR14_MYTCO|nr:unnamed protein product [Mytilus coruscus]